MKGATGNNKQHQPLYNRLIRSYLTSVVQSKGNKTISSKLFVKSIIFLFLAISVPLTLILAFTNQDTRQLAYPGECDGPVCAANQRCLTVLSGERGLCSDACPEGWPNKCIAASTNEDYKYTCCRPISPGPGPIICEEIPECPNYLFIHPNNHFYSDSSTQCVNACPNNPTAMYKCDATNHAGTPPPPPEGLSYLYSCGYIAISPSLLVPNVNCNERQVELYWSAVDGVDKYIIELTIVKNNGEPYGKPRVYTKTGTNITLGIGPFTNKIRVIGFDYETDLFSASSYTEYSCSGPGSGGR